jgi:hypothetical protein
MVFACEPGYVGLDTYDVPNQRLVSHHFIFGAGRQARLSAARTVTSGQRNRT